MSHDYYAILEPAPAALVRTALELDVFATLGVTRVDVDELARRLTVSRRGLDCLLRGLAALGLLSRHGVGVESTAAGRRLSHGDRHALMAAFAETGSPFDSVWRGLTDAVRRGGGGLAEPDAFFSSMNRSLEVQHRRPAALLADLLGAEHRRTGAQILDIGCGSAIWSRAIAARDRTCTVTAQDLPGVLQQTRVMVAADGLTECYRYQPGSCLDRDFGVGAFDLVLIAHVLHLLDEESSRALVATAARCLAADGTLAIVEFLVDDSRPESNFTAFFAALMLVVSSGGNAWNAATVRDWATSAGLGEISAVADSLSPASFVFCRSRRQVD